MGGEIPPHRDTTSAKEETRKKLYDPLQMKDKERRSFSPSDSDSESHSSSDSSEGTEENQKIKALKKDIKVMERKLEEKKQKLTDNDNRIEELDRKWDERIPGYDERQELITENFVKRTNLASEQDDLSKKLDRLNEQMGLNDLIDEPVLPQGPEFVSLSKEREEVINKINENKDTYSELDAEADRMKKEQMDMLDSHSPQEIPPEQQSEYKKLGQENKYLDQEIQALQRQKEEVDTKLSVLQGPKTLEQIFGDSSKNRRGGFLPRKRLFDESE